MSGMITSHTTTSGLTRVICSMASFPEAAANTSNRFVTSVRSTTFLTLTLSSTTSTVGMFVCPSRSSGVIGAVGRKLARRRQDRIDQADERLLIDRLGHVVPDAEAACQALVFLARAS